MSRPSSSSILTLEEVAQWLTAHHYPLTALELFEESKSRLPEHPNGYTPLRAFAVEAARQQPVLVASDPTAKEATAPPRSGAVTTDEVLQDVREAVRCARAVLHTLEPSPPPSTCFAAADQLVLGCVQQALGLSLECGAAPSNTAEKSGAEGRTGAAALETWKAKADTAESQLSSLRQHFAEIMGILAERVPALVHATHPQQQQLLLPLMRILYHHGQTSALRATGSRLMFRLLKSPSYENRQCLVEEFSLMVVAGIQQQRDALRQTPPNSSTQRGSVPLSVLETELLPELYGLVNEEVAARRLLAIDCVVGMAPALCSAAVLEEEEAPDPGSLHGSSALLGTLERVRAALFRGVLLPLSEDRSSTVRREVPRALVALWWPRLHSLSTGHVRADRDACDPASPNSCLVCESPSSFFSVRSTKLPLERLVRLALDASSASVRHVAQLQLREVVYPHCFERFGSVLQSCYPVWVAFMNHEMLALRGELGFGPETGSLTAYRATPSSGVDTKELRVTPPSRSSAVTMVSYGPRRQHPKAHWDLVKHNLRVLLALVRDSVEFLCAAIDNLHQQQHYEEWMNRRVALAKEYVEQVLPLTQALLTTCYEEATVFCREQIGPLWCTLAAELAGLVPSLLGEAEPSAALELESTLGAGWSSIRSYLQRALTDALPSEEGTALFVYSFLIRIAGGQTVFTQQVEHILAGLLGISPFTVRPHAVSLTPPPHTATSVLRGTTSTAVLSTTPGGSTHEQPFELNPLHAASSFRELQDRVGLEAGQMLAETLYAEHALLDGDSSEEVSPVKREMLARVCGQCFCWMTGASGELLLFQDFHAALKSKSSHFGASASEGTASMAPSMLPPSVVPGLQQLWPSALPHAEVPSRPSQPLPSSSPLVNVTLMAHHFSGVMAGLWAFAESPDPRRRLQATRLLAVLLRAVGSGPLSPSADGEWRTRDARHTMEVLRAALLQCVCPAIVPLLHDPCCAVLPPAAVSVLLSCAAHLRGTLHAQEQLVLMPLFAFMESQPASHPLTCRFVQQWVAEFHQIPAELREAFLLPYLAQLTARLVDELRTHITPQPSKLANAAVSTTSTSIPRASHPERPTSSTSSSSTTANQTATNLEAGWTSTEEPVTTTASPEWVAAVQAVCTLLMALSRCALVEDPAKVTEQHLLPAFRHMTSLLHQQQCWTSPLHAALQELVPVHRQLRLSLVRGEAGHLSATGSAAAPAASVGNEFFSLFSSFVGTHHHKKS